MKVILRFGMAGPNGSHRAGSIVDLPDDVALHLLKTNQADRVEKAEPEDTLEEVETAALEVNAEKAVLPKGKKKKRK